MAEITIFKLSFQLLLITINKVNNKYDDFSQYIIQI